MARPKGYSELAMRYYVSNDMGVGTSLERFKEDLGYAGGRGGGNPARSWAGLFIAGAASLGRLRNAPIEAISPHDLPFARKVKGLFEEVLVGTTVEITRFDRRTRGAIPWVGSGVVKGVVLYDGFGYDRSELNSPMSPDCIEIATGDGTEMHVDCPDLLGLAGAAHDTVLRIDPQLRPRLLADVTGYLELAPPPESPQAL